MKTRATPGAAADAYVAAARAGRRAGVHAHLDQRPTRTSRASCPSVGEYRKWVGNLVKRYYKAKGVKEWGVWNEANHKSQPTYKSPKRAAQYFMIMRKLCQRLHDRRARHPRPAPAPTRYIDRFYRALKPRDRRRAKLVGIHNYSDTNRYRSAAPSRSSSAVASSNRSAKFWLTETGGVVNFGTSFTCNHQRAAKADQVHVHAGQAATAATSRACTPTTGSAPTELPGLRRRPRQRRRQAAPGLQVVQEAVAEVQALGRLASGQRPAVCSAGAPG